MADNETTSIKATVTTDPTTNIQCVWSCSAGYVLPSRTNPAACNYQYVASKYPEYVYLNTFPEGVDTDNIDNCIGGAVWQVVSRPDIVASPAVTNGVMGEAYGPITFSVPNQSSVSWQNIPSLVASRRGSTFADALEKTDPSTATKITTLGDGFSPDFNFPAAGANIEYFRIYNGSISGYAYQPISPWKNVSVYISGGLNDGTCLYEKDGDGVYCASDSESATFRFKYELVTGSTSEGGTTTGGDGTVITGEGGTTSATPVTNDVNFAITIYTNGEVTVSYGDCGTAMTSGQTVYETVEGYASGGGSNTSSESASNMQDVVFTRTGLPNGLVFYTSTGALSGTPTETGTFSFTVSAYVSAMSATLTKDYTIVVAEGDPVPTYQQKTPAIGEGTFNMAATQEQDFTVEAQNEASDVTYQWYLKTSGNPVEIVGATEKTFCLNANTYGNGNHELCFVAYWDGGMEYAEVSWNVSVSGVTEPTFEEQTNFRESSTNYYGIAGGGAFIARLVNCTVSGNVAGSKTDDRVDSVFGGGAYGGSLDTCRVSGNYLRTQSAQTHVRCEGAGTYDAEVRNSYVWDNYVDCGSGTSAVPSCAEKGVNGVVIHSEDKAPTAARVEAHTDPIPQEGTTTVYASKGEAQSAAAKQVISISTEVATVVEAQLDDALTGDANGDPQSAEALQAELSPDTQVMEKTLKTTTPGLYYALEFSSDMSAGSFKGERHLATGSGSIKLKATSLQTSSGFWRVNVYLTPRRRLMYLFA